MSWLSRSRVLGRMVPGLAATAVGVGAVVAIGMVGAVGAEEPAAPVVLVPGWHPGSANGVEETSLATLARRLAGDGHPVYWAAGVGADRSATTYENAERLGAIVADVSRRHDGAGVAIVGHSYGGIVARALLESDLYDAVRSKGGRVDSLVTLGTPMAGVDMWLPFLFVLGDPLTEPTVWELTPAYMQAFNAVHRPNRAVRYTLVSGDARSQSWLLRLLPPSDGVVTVSSARALCARCYGLSEPVTDDVHSPHMVASALHWHSYLDAADTYRDVILPSLMPRTTSSGRPAGALSTDAAASYQTEPWPHTPIRWVPLAPGQTADVSDAQVGSVLMAAGDGVVIDVGGAPDAPTELVDGEASQVVGRTQVMNRSGVPTTAAVTRLLPPGATPFRLTADRSTDALHVTVETGAHEPTGTWCEVVSRGGRRVVPLAAKAGTDATTATYTRVADVSVDPGYYLVRAGAEVDGQSVESDTVVVVPYRVGREPAAITGVWRRQGGLEIGLIVNRPGTYVVSAGPSDSVAGVDSGTYDTAVRALAVGRTSVFVALDRDAETTGGNEILGTQAGVAPSIEAHAVTQLVVRAYRADEGLMRSDERLVRLR